MKWNSKFNPWRKIGGNILRYENHQKPPYNVVFGGLFQLKKVQIWPVWADGRDGCWRGPRLIPGGPAIEMLVCMGPVVGRGAGGAPVWSDLIRSGGGQLLKRLACTGPVVGRGADGALRTEPAVDFDAYGAIFTHSSHYSPSYSSLVEFIFFNCILIFPRPRGADNDQFYLIISVRSIFSCSEREKTIHNNEIKIMIADHTHAWTEIRTTYDWSVDIAVQKWIFVEYKIRKNVWMNTNPPIQEVLSVMFQ